MAASCDRRRHLSIADTIAAVASPHTMASGRSCPPPVTPAGRVPSHRGRRTRRLLSDLRIWERGVHRPHRISSMLAELPTRPSESDGVLHRRAVALANVRWFRAMAWRASRDGLPKGELRAANARAAARIVLRQARRDAAIVHLARSGVAITPSPARRGAHVDRPGPGGR